jgi:SAM-dependent methyltransferase
MVYQHPLAYLLGLEGVALLRAFGGEHDREFAEARIAEIRRLLDRPELGGPGVTAERVGTVAGYRVWARTYDEPGNGLFAFEEPLVHATVDPLPPGVALDAACGTGRHAGYLVGRGHRTIGVDSSPEMLAQARARVPGADFRHGDLDRLPVPDHHVDVVVCALALVHLSELGPAFREFARVLRPGGRLIVTDVHHETVALGSVPRMRSSAGEPGLLPAYRHRAADYLAAALPLGLRVRRCEEPVRTGGGVPGEPPAELVPGPWDDWPWSLVGLVPAASAAAWNDAPAVIFWDFELTGPGAPAPRPREPRR